MQQLEMLDKPNESKCSKCQEVKPLTEFHRDSKAKNKAFAYCKECSCEKAKKNHFKNRDKALERMRLYNKSRHRSTAHNKVTAALRSGVLKRQPCEICGAEKTDAHHDDYGKPLDVRWLCRSHHIQWHVDNGKALNSLTVHHWTPPTQEQQP